MMRQRFIIISIMFFLLFLLPLPAASGYSIEEMSSRVEVTSKGVYRVNESIIMNFATPLHGFYRTLPVEYLFDDPDLEDIRVHVSKVRASDTLSISHSGSHMIIRVGNADRTVTGLQRYSISYDYDIGPDRNSGYDEFYFNIVGEDWEVPIGRFAFSIEFPSPVSREAVSFSRGYRGTTAAAGIDWLLSDDGRTLTGSTSRLMPGEAVTIRVQMPEGYYAARTDWQALLMVVFLVLSIASIGLAIFIWLRFGRDRDLVVVPRFKPPEGMSPMDLGYIVDETLDTRDVTSMIFYWADKGCLTIVEDGKKFSFIRGRDPENPSIHEKQLFEAFFSYGKNGMVKASDLEGKFFQSYRKLSKTIASYYRGERALASPTSRNMATLVALLSIIPVLGYALSLTANYPGPATVALFTVSLCCFIALTAIAHFMMRKWHLRGRAGKAWWILIFCAVAVAGWLLLVAASMFANAAMNDGLLAATIAMATIAPLSLFAIVTKQRSEYGRRRIEEILGFREFIDKVEMDKLQRMIDEDPHYYYHVLSFAIVLGLEKKWANTFASITLEPPSWYVGRYSVWDAVFLGSVLSRCNGALISSVAAAPKASPGSRFGGSSFGGGGFSGGGFGGGGGGAW